MEKNKSDFLQVLNERGFQPELSKNELLAKQLESGTLAAYIGFDATAPSLHIGSLKQIMMLYWFQQTGNKPIVLMGGGTSMIGDPSGKDEARLLMTREIIEQNKNSIQKCFANFLTFGNGETDALMVDNSEWLLELNYVEFLRDYGKFISVNSMLKRDAVKNRIDREQHLSFLEFNYMCLQAYDFVELARRYDCRLQMGGSDQWGNIVSGIDLGARVGTKQLFGLTTPLVETSSGAKMGKTAEGAIWLNGDMLEPFDFWQYWRNVADADVIRFLKLFTTLPLSDIEKFSKLEGQELNEAKILLANEITTMVHGRAESQKAESTARQTFIEKTDTALPVLKITADLAAGIGALEFIVLAGLAQSNSEARRHVEGNAIRINDELLSEPTAKIGTSHRNENGHIKISFGKKKHILIQA